MKKFLASLPGSISALVAVLALFSYFMSRHQERSWGFSTLHSRYTFIAHRSQLIVRSPPAAKWTRAEEQAWNEVKRLRNEDIDWTIQDTDSINIAPYAWLASPHFRVGTPGYRLSRMSGISVLPFLRALDGPRKFLAADILLTQRYSSRGTSTGISFPLDGAPHSESYTTFLLKLKRPVPASGAAPVPIRFEDLAIDARGLPRIRDQWHMALDVTLLTINIGWIVGISLILPLLYVVKIVQRRRRFLSGHCLKCNYDLRASTGVCPECGAPIPKNASAASTV